jgi:hypothetical protein
MLLEKFGKVYVNEVKKVDKGFVDVLVGQCKESSLQNYPHLCVQGAPSVRLFSLEPLPIFQLIHGKQTACRGGKLAMISEHLAGGDCLNVGCVPSSSKAL